MGTFAEVSRARSRPGRPLLLAAAAGLAATLGVPAGSGVGAVELRRACARTARSARRRERRRKRRRDHRSRAVPAPTWRRRPRTGGKPLAFSMALVKPERLPPEPKRPAVAKPDRFAGALRQLCGSLLPTHLIGHLARWTIRYADRFRVDPFTLGALLCFRGDRPPSGKFQDTAVGLMALHLDGHRPFVHDGRYRYWTLSEGRWKARQLSVDRFDWSLESLERPEPNIYFSAALLAIYGTQCRAIDGAFGSVKHRHPVAHMIWGDRVQGREAEEIVLRERRRLLAYYTGKHSTLRGRLGRMPLRSPLDGPPRKLLSRYGARRGRRRHQGVDIVATIGEPVRAIADGVAYFAGYSSVETPSQRLPPEESPDIARDITGRGGLFVLLRHRRGLVSGYFHLHSYVVRNGQRVKAGQLIGRVGRTGVYNASPHLHFELRRGKRHVNPRRYFRRVLLPLRATFAKNHAARRRYLHRRGRGRRHRRRARGRSHRRRAHRGRRRARRHHR